MNNIVTKKFGNLTMYLDLNDGGISRALYTNGDREKIFMGILRNTVKEGMTCIDLGANIGYATIHMLDRAGQSGIVYAIEPDEHNINLLKRTIEANNFTNCEIAKCAISDINGELDFWIAAKPNLNSVKKTKHSIRKEVVSCYTLEKFLEGKKYPNFIKMDVEGHEVKIFEGAYEYFKNNNDGKTYILVEVHPHYYDEDNNFEKILKKYFEIGFKPEFVVSTPVPNPKLFVEAGYEPLAQIPTDGFIRGLYKDIKEDDLLRFACHENIEGTSKKIVRSFLIKREENENI